MKQILTKKGLILVDEVPAPLVSDDSVLVKVAYSCISSGTELADVNSSGQSLFNRAIKEPEKVVKTFNDFKKEGLMATIKKVHNKIHSYSSGTLGYSASGVALEVGKNITSIKVGDRVACAGSNIANHAEYINVPRNLIVKVPSGLDLDVASTVTLGAIALQGVRRADAKLSENIAVIGLGVLGQITVQLLKANGCKVIGIELDEERIYKACELGLDFGINPKKENPVEKTIAISNGYGVDTVIITTATTSKKPLSQGFQMCRKKGKVVLVGVVGMEFNRDDIYQKELDFLISTSYGPGRYDENYEQKGVEYPYAYVRWTETRNMEAYLQLIADKKINIKPLIEKEYTIDEAPNAYEELKTPATKPLIVLMKYNQNETGQIIKKIEMHSVTIKKDGRINIALIGAGEFAKEAHLPNLMKLKKTYNLSAVASKTGVNAKSIAQQYNAQYVTTDYREILGDKNIDAVIIATRHNLHAKMAIETLEAGKAVLLEKPMALNQEELDELVKTIKKSKQPFMVGFNRRFSEYAVEAKRSIEGRVNPMIINYQMNAGHIPVDHWVHTEEGGGRIVGEACHIFDLFNYFTEAEIESISFDNITPQTAGCSAHDNVVITIKYNEGSVCSLTYAALGSSQYWKEFCQIYFDGKIIIIKDYKKLEGYGLNLRKLKSSVPQKGLYEELIEFSKYMKGEIQEPIPLWQLTQATKISFVVGKEL